MSTSRSLAVVGAAVVGFVAIPAHAAVDVTAALAAINDTLPAIASIGSAVFGVHIAIKVWKWMRRAT